MREMTGDGALAEDQRRGNLPVRPTRRNERGDAPLGRGQPCLTRAPAEGAEFLASALDPAGSAKLLEGRQGGFERLAGGALLPRPPADDTERKQRSCPAERISESGSGVMR